MGPEYLKEKFPEMRQVSKPPAMFTFNGIGTTVYGERDYDDETATYVKTLFFTFVFLPILALGAYRVADGEGGGWYFIGKVPLSGLTKGYNFLVGAMVMLAFAGISIGTYLDSPDYRAGEQLDEAAKLVDDGEFGPAAKAYGAVASGYSSHAEDAKATLGELATTGLDDLGLADAAVVLDEATKHEAIESPKAVSSGMKLLEAKAADDPQGAVLVLETITPLAADPEAFSKQRRTLLEGLVEKHPEQVAFAASLAVDLERAGETARCEALLEPHLDKLGTTEGARILGQIYAARGEYDKAYALLEPYTKKRLKMFRAAQDRYQSAYESAERSIVNSLQIGTAPQSFYDEYDAATEAEKQAIVSEYVNERLEDRPMVKGARAELEKHVDVVPVALDMGMILLNRAQSLPDPAARDAELEKAKKTFLSVRVIASNSPQFQLYLGQVHFWLGEHDKGQQQFDTLLASANRDAQTLVTVAYSLREVGLRSQARDLAEEAYNKSESEENKAAAASLRALTATDVDERIKWYGRANQEMPEIKASLAGARADRAILDGDKKEAQKQLREQIRIYSEQPESPGALNNTAVAYFKLYDMTGKDADFDKAAELMDKAQAMAPSDSVVVWNVASSYESAGLRDIIGTSVNLSRIGQSPSVDVLPFLYKDARGRDAYAKKLEEHPAIKKALGAMERARLLAPKAAWIYTSLLELHRRRRDVQGLEGLLAQVEEVEFDTTDAFAQAQAYWSGSSDAKMLAELDTHAAEFDQVLQELKPRQHRVEFAIAAHRRAAIEFKRADMGAEADVARGVSLVEKAHKIAPSSATHNMLRNAYVRRAIDTLAANNAAFATQVNTYRRSLGDLTLFVIALEDDALRTQLLADRDAKEVIRLIEKGNRMFPTAVSSWEWAVFRHVDPAKADTLEQRHLSDREGNVRMDINRRLYPFEVPLGYMDKWHKEAAGKHAEANAVLKAYADRGVPVPL